MKFIIQKIDGDIKFDFQLELINSIDAHNFYHPDDKIQIKYGEFLEKIDNPEEFCPIGSVEYVLNFFKIHFGDESIPRPINVPYKLMDYTFTKRYIDNITIDDNFKETHKSFDIDLYVKSNDVIKSSDNGVYRGGFKNIPNGNYQVSKLLPYFKSEFRCFVYEKELLDIRRYSGDYSILPDFDKIKGMITVYSNSPHAYTLDVGVTENGETVVIEVHDFFSCGLYGFLRTDKLPYMFWRWYYYYVKNFMK